jgi:hypothetical protein
MRLKTLLGYAVIAFILWWIIKQPVGAAHDTKDIGNFLSEVAQGFSQFLSSI